MRLARLRAEHESLAALVPPVPANHQRVLAYTGRRRDDLRYRLGALDREQTHTEWHGTAVGRALQARKTVHYQRSSAELHSHEGPLRKRPGFARQARDAARREVPLEAAYRDPAAQARQELLPQVSEADEAAADLVAGSWSTSASCASTTPKSPGAWPGWSGRWAFSTARCPTPAPSWNWSSVPTGNRPTPAGHRRAHPPGLP